MKTYTKILSALALTLISLTAQAELKLDPQASFYFVDQRPVDGVLEGILLVPTANPFEQRIVVVRDYPRTPELDEYTVVAEKAECVYVGSDSYLRCVAINPAANEGIIFFANNPADETLYIKAYKQLPGGIRQDLVTIQSADYTDDQEFISLLLGE